MAYLWIYGLWSVFADNALMIAMEANARSTKFAAVRDWERPLPCMNVRRGENDEAQRS